MPCDGPYDVSQHVAMVCGVSIHGIGWSLAVCDGAYDVSHHVVIVCGVSMHGVGWSLAV